MTHPTCSFPDCGRPHSSRGLCNGHRQQFHKGIPLRPLHLRTPADATLAEQFWFFVVKSDACWGWRGEKNAHGYGRFYPRRNTGEAKDYAHRWAWRLLRGPIPEGLVIDHLCRNTSCVNPDHLEPVTQRVNVLRGRRRNRRDLPTPAVLG